MSGERGRPTPAFSDQSTAAPLEKALRVLRHIANPDAVYFFDDGFPRPVLSADAAAAVAALEVLRHDTDPRSEYESHAPHALHEMARQLVDYGERWLGLTEAVPTAAAPERSFTDGKRWTATDVDCAMLWGGADPGERFRCALCGHQFQPGDAVRWQYTNDTPGAGGNPLLCYACDGPKEEIVAKIRQRRAELNSSWNWWFTSKRP